MIYSISLPLFLLPFLASAQNSTSSTTLAPPATHTSSAGPGESGQYFALPASDTPRYITLSSCSQSGSRLTLFASNDSSTRRPSKAVDGAVAELAVDGGRVGGLEVQGADGVWIGVYGRGDSAWELGAYEADLALPSPSRSLYFEDSDATSALLTSLVEGTSSDISAFILPANTSLPSSPSRCLLRSLVPDTLAVNSSTTQRGLGTANRTQLEVTGLERGSNYSAWMHEGVEGGHWWEPVYFQTKRADNCRLLHSLPFCPNLAQAVPAPPNMSTNDLISAYNSSLSPNFRNFNLSLSIFPCGQSMYSYIKTCDDCRAAYRDWACAAVMPRCTDASAASSVDVNVSPVLRGGPSGNASRSAVVRGFDGLGEYAETLPCIELCQEVDRACPPAMSFRCPLAGITAERSYSSLEPGTFAAVSRYGDVRCNAMGIDLVLTAANGSLELYGPWRAAAWALSPFMVVLLGISL